MATRRKDELQLQPYPGNVPDGLVQNIQDGVQSYQQSTSGGWLDQMKGLMNQIGNRAPFQYDANKDALYQNYKNLYTRAGQQAMQDTMGQAAALTGGYDSSYANNVGQQAYNAYLEKLNAAVPELYAQARSAYDQEGQDLYNRLGAAQNMYSMLYGQERDAVNDQRYQDELDYDRQRQAYNDAMNRWNALGVADQGIADALGVQVGATTADQAYREWQMRMQEQERAESQAQSNRSETRSYVLNLLGMGIMPSAQDLQTAGISTTDAQAILAYYRAQMAGVGGGSGGGSSGGSRSSGSGSRSSGGSGGGSGSGSGSGNGSTGGTEYGPGVDDATYKGLRQTIYTLRQQGRYTDIEQLLDQWQSRLSYEQAQALMGYGL